MMGSAMNYPAQLLVVSIRGQSAKKRRSFPDGYVPIALILLCFTTQKGKYSFSKVLWRVLSAICRYLIFKVAIFNHNIHMLLYRFGLFVSVIFFYVITYAKLEKSGFLPGDVEKNRHPLNKTG